MEEEEVKKLFKEARRKEIEFCVVMTSIEDINFVVSVENVHLGNKGLVTSNPLPTAVSFLVITDIKAVVPFNKL